MILISIALLAGVVICFGPVRFMEWGFLTLSGEDTEYASGYSERDFQKIAIGDSEADVLAAVGRPLQEWTVEPYVSWLYADEPSPEFANSGDWPDIMSSYTAITFGADGGLADAFGQISHGSNAGLFSTQRSASFGDGSNTLSITNAEIEKLKAEQATPEQIEVRFGKPREKFESHVVKWLRYSHSPGGTHYRLRMIGIDREGKVCRKRSEIYWD